MAKLKMTPAKIAQAQMLLDDHIPINYVAKRIEVSRQRLHTYFKRGVLTKR